MIEFFRVVVILSRYRIWSYLSACLVGVRLPLYPLLMLLEALFYPFRVESKDFGDALCASLQKLGPVYIKLGQTLSTRADIIGQIAEPLSRLQDRLSPFSSDIAVSIFRAECGKSIAEVFAHFEQNPIAAASIAQVHKATLLTGEKVAVKIMRPNIEVEYAKDIRFFYYIGRLLERRYPKFKPLEIIDIFNSTMKQELDFRLEASSCSEMNDNFACDETVYIPKVYWGATSKRVLTTSWIDGVSIYDRSAVIELGLDPIALSQSAAVMFFNQSYRDGFFHADLHPGNVFAMPDGRIALVDFGIMGRLSEHDRLSVAEIVFGVIKRDYTAVAKTYLRAGYIPQNTDVVLFAQRCRAICEPIAGLALKDISLAKILEQLCGLTEEFGMHAQPQLILLQKSMVILEGIGISLNREINMWELVEPWIKKWAIKNITPEAKLLRLLKNFIETALTR
jgi:ubiquinone biosynthesis protein